MILCRCCVPSLNLNRAAIWTLSYDDETQLCIPLVMLYVSHNIVKVHFRQYIHAQFLCRINETRT